jgi:hypothetical protein
VSELSICFAAQPRSSRGAIVSSVIVVISRFRLCLDNPTLPRITAGATDRPTLGGRFGRPLSGLLHHQPGHDYRNGIDASSH